MDSVGDFVVAWGSYGENLGSPTTSLPSAYNSAGRDPGKASSRPTHTRLALENFAAAVAMDSAGNFVVAWDGPANFDTIYAQRYSAAGVAQGADFQVSAPESGIQKALAVAMDPRGDFVVAWEQLEGDGDGYGIFAERFNASGAPQGSGFLVNTYTTGFQRFPSVAMDSAGDFVISWGSIIEPLTGAPFSYFVSAQRYDAAGVAQGSEFRVNTYTTDGAFHSSVAMDSAGDFVVTWASYYDGSDSINAPAYNARWRVPVQGSEFTG